MAPETEFQTRIGRASWAVLVVLGCSSGGTSPSTSSAGSATTSASSGSASSSSTAASTSSGNGGSHGGEGGGGGGGGQGGSATSSTGTGGALACPPADCPTGQAINCDPACGAISAECASVCDEAAFVELAFGVTEIRTPPITS